MKYKDYGFRFFDQCFVVFPLEVLGGKQECFSDDNLVLTYGYVDHEDGFVFEVLAYGKKQGDEFLFADALSDRILIEAKDVSEIDGFVIHEDEEYRKRFAERIIRKDNKEIEYSREMAFFPTYSF